MNVAQIYHWCNSTSYLSVKSYWCNNKDKWNKLRNLLQMNVLSAKLVTWLYCPYTKQQDICWKIPFQSRNFNFLEDNTESRTHYITMYSSFLCGPFIYSCTARVQLDHVTCCTSPLCKNSTSLSAKFCPCDLLCFVNVGLNCVSFQSWNF